MQKLPLNLIFSLILIFFITFSGFNLCAGADEAPETISSGSGGLPVGATAPAISEATRQGNISILNNEEINNSIRSENKCILTSQYNTKISSRVMLLYHNFTLNLFSKNGGVFKVYVNGTLDFTANAGFYYPVNYSFPFIDRLGQIKVYYEYQGQNILLYETPETIIIRHINLDEKALDRAEPQTILFSLHRAELKNVFYSVIYAFILAVPFALILMFWYFRKRPFIVLSGSSPPKDATDYITKKSDTPPKIPLKEREIKTKGLD